MTKSNWNQKRNETNTPNFLWSDSDTSKQKNTDYKEILKDHNNRLRDYLDDFFPE